MKKREAINLGLHIGIGGVLTALVMWHPLMIIFDTFVYVTLREQAQHRWALVHRTTDRNHDNMRLYSAIKRSFWDWTWFRWKHAFEIGQWTVGSAVVSTPWYYFG